MKKIMFLLGLLLLVSLACGETSVSEKPIVPTVVIVDHGMYTCDVIASELDGMTDLQWKNHVGTYEGEQIYFRGSVTEVYDDGRINVSDCKGFGHPVVLYGIPPDVAITYNKRQMVEGEGIIRNIGFLGVIHVDVVEMK